MMKELLVMVSEEFRKEYHDTTGKIYRNIIKLDKLANGMKVGTWFE